MVDSSPAPVLGEAVLLGLRTVIYPAPDLAAAKAWFTDLLGSSPYFDEPFYVGFAVGGYELTLDPSGDPATGPVTYWGVSDAAVERARLLAAGAQPEGEVQDVGDGIRVAVVRLPHGGGRFGVIENPHFQVAAVDQPGNGPGR